MSGFLKRWLVAAAIKRTLKRAASRLPENEMKWILALLTGRKEIITAVVGAVSLLLAAFGILPEFVSALKPISEAVASGDWKAALSAFVAALALLMRAAWRAKTNRDEKAWADDVRAFDDDSFNRDTDQP